MDLTAAYDTVWHTGLLAKLTMHMPFWFVQLVELLLRNRRLRVHIGDDTSAWRLQRNGLPQGSVLAPTLFNLCTNDLPATKSRKFIYVDDICLGTQSHTFVKLECSLTADMARMAQYSHRWRLKPSITKTVSSVFHLHNAVSSHELTVMLNGARLKHDQSPSSSV
jgi:Reverse transcriptase (RNA-dependent DNA polymerase)